jgi:hypothetical protein
MNGRSCSRHLAPCQLTCRLEALELLCQDSSRCILPHKWGAGPMALMLWLD